MQKLNVQGKFLDYFVKVILLLKFEDNLNVYSSMMYYHSIV